MYLLISLVLLNALGWFVIGKVVLELLRQLSGQPGRYVQPGVVDRVVGGVKDKLKDKGAPPKAEEYLDLLDVPPEEAMRAIQEYQQEQDK